MHRIARFLPCLALAPLAAWARPESRAYEMGYAVGQQIGQLARIAPPLLLVCALVAGAAWLAWRAYARRRAVRLPE